MSAPAARLEGVSKDFGATCALAGIDFDVDYGEIHAVVGENGAGKSTLVRILGGVHRPDRGLVEVDGKPCHFASPHDAIAAGVVTIPQELRLVPALSIAENIVLGDPPVHRFGPLTIVDRARMREEARALLAELDFHPDVDAPVRALGTAERQLVAIARALRRRCRVFVLDEPTAALEEREVQRLFAVLGRMKVRGTAVIYISHRLDEVVAIADRCTVLRDGKVVSVSRRGGFNVHDLVVAMTGGGADETVVTAATPGKPLLAGKVDDATTMRLHARQAIGFAGLLGSGADTVLRRLFGAGGKAALVEVEGYPRRLRHPADAVAAGMGLVPPDRAVGLVLNQSVRDNILLPNLAALSRLGVIDRAAGDRVVAELMELLDIRPRQPRLKARALSGGNQQKIILAKWLARRIAVLLLDEPTQGIDVAAKTQIHALIRDFVTRGGGVLVHSSDLAELARLCDSVLAFREGRIAATIERGTGLDEPKLRAAIGA